MKIAEILDIYRPGLERLDKAGAEMRDIRYLDIFHEYEHLCAEGNKRSYAIAKVAQAHGMTERKVYYIVKRLKKDL